MDDRFALLIPEPCKDERTSSRLLSRPDTTVTANLTSFGGRFVFRLAVTVTELESTCPNKTAADSRKMIMKPRFRMPRVYSTHGLCMSTKSCQYQGNSPLNTFLLTFVLVRLCS